MALFTNLEGVFVEYPEIARYQEAYRDGQREITRFFMIDWDVEGNTFAQVMLGTASVNLGGANPYLPLLSEPSGNANGPGGDAGGALNNPYVPLDDPAFAALPGGAGQADAFPVVTPDFGVLSNPYLPFLPDVNNQPPVNALTRRLPAHDPVFLNCYADSVELIDPIGVAIPLGVFVDAQGDRTGYNPVQFADGSGATLNLANAGPRQFALDAATHQALPPGKAIMQVTFRQLPYDLLPDLIPDGQPGAGNRIREERRFVSWETQNAGENLQIAFTDAFRYPDGVALPPSAAALPIPLTTLKVKWWKVPQVPLGVYSYYGRCNANPIVFGTASQYPAGPQQLMFAGAQLGPLQFFPDGNTYRDIEMTFIQRIQGWNRLFRPGTGHNKWEPVSRTGSQILPFTEGNYPHLPTPLENMFTYP